MSDSFNDILYRCDNPVVPEIDGSCSEFTNPIENTFFAVEQYTKNGT